MKPVLASTLLAVLMAHLPLVASAAEADGKPASVQTRPASADVEYHALPAGPLANLPFSEAVRVGNMLYLSGELGTRADGKLASGGIEAETRQMMDNIGAKLARHGSSFEHVVQCTVALLDMKEWPAFNTVYRTYFKQGRYPARMAFAASGLALDARVELQCNAVVATAG